eukprot:3486842-Pyramimonas_sp.AAC.1
MDMCPRGPRARATRAERRARAQLGAGERDPRAGGDVFPPSRCARRRRRACRRALPGKGLADQGVEELEEQEGSGGGWS